MPEGGPAIEGKGKEAPTIIVAFDFGRKRIGIASGDTLTRRASPRTAIANGSQGPDWPGIERVLADSRPSRLVVGEPYNADGTASPLTESARAFAADLAYRTHLAVDMVDERWSSLDAEERLRGERARGERSRRVTREAIDATAAAVILERWFSQQQG